MNKFFRFLLFLLFLTKFEAQSSGLFLTYEEDDLGIINPISILSNEDLMCMTENISSSPSTKNIKMEKIESEEDIFMPFGHSDSNIEGSSFDEDFMNMRRLPLNEEDPTFFGLSIDGGGIRGLIPALLIEHLDNSLKEGEHQVGVERVFDVFGGTSVGGLLSLGLCHGKTPSSLVFLFQNQGKTIFPASKRFLMPKKVNNFINNCKNLVFRRYDNDPLKKLLQSDDFFGSNRLNAMNKDVLVTACGTDGFPHILKSHPFSEEGDVDYINSREIPIWQAALATSAAPTFFPAVRVNFASSGAKDLVDGGIWCNNPSFLVATHMVKKFKAPLQNMRILSLGTGESPADFLSKSGGEISMAGPIIDVLMRSNSTGTHMIMSSLFGQKYKRINPFLENSIGLNSTSDDDLRTLRTAAETAQGDISDFLTLNNDIIRLKLEAQNLGL